MDEYEVNEARLTSILAGFGSLPAGSRHILVRELIEQCEPGAALDALIIAANHPEADDTVIERIAGSGGPTTLAAQLTPYMDDEALATLVMLLEDSCDGGADGIAAAWWSARTEAEEVWPEVDAWPTV